MRFFISAGEPSGDLHGANLARALRTVKSDVELFGLGGSKMREAGVDLSYPLAEHAVMGFVHVLRVVPQMIRLVNQMAREFEHRRPDAVVLIDYPGFHWWLAAKAKSMGIPVISFVPPQIWAWASHRIRKMRAYFDHVLCALPFEESWFRERGMANADYVGHPYFDELPRQQLDQRFLDHHRSAGNPIVALLPGSRGHEVRHNLATLLNTADCIHDQRPDVRFIFPCFKEDHQQIVAAEIARRALPADAVVHRTAEVIALADACVAVSGSVSLELLYRCKPTVVIYRTNRFYMALTRKFKNVPFISLVNLLADRELFPEFLIDRDEGPGPAGHVLNWLNDSAERYQITQALAELKEQVAAPGACEKAAQFLIQRYGTRRNAAA